MNKLKRAGIFTDIHFGRKSNSKIHNTDCSSFIDWFYDQCVEYEVDHIVFLGDWFEERQAIDSLTATIALNCAKKLNSLKVPVYFVVGNHDLYYRDNREVFATYVYSELSNFTIIDHPTVVQDTLKPTLYCPFLFEEEYPGLSTYFDIPIWMGHFEFKGFILTGDSVVKESGPDPNKFSAPDHIFSGHFHKRQKSKNITYVGNTFPMDFSDANDEQRGMSIFDYESNEIQFIDWKDSPKYMRVNLSELLDDPSLIRKGSRIKCTADIDISYNENSEIKRIMMDKFQLREFNIEEKMIITINEGELSEEDIRLETTNNLVRKLIKKIESDTINNETLLKIYDEL